MTRLRPSKKQLNVRIELSTHFDFCDLVPAGARTQVIEQLLIDYIKTQSEHKLKLRIKDGTGE